MFTNFSSSRAGVGILFNNNFYFQILKYFVDPEGRFIIADIKIQDKTLTLVASMRLTRMNLLFFNFLVNLTIFSFPRISRQN